MYFYKQTQVEVSSFLECYAVSTGKEWLLGLLEHEEEGTTNTVHNQAGVFRKKKG
jgi:hypothetical protein